MAIAINPDIGHQDLGSLRILSLSSGSNPQWTADKILMIDANVDIADYRCRLIRGEKAYFHFDSEMPSRMATDDCLSLDELMRLAWDSDISEATGMRDFSWTDRVSYFVENCEAHMRSGASLSDCRGA